MKACVLEAIGELQYKEVECPKPKENEVLVRIKACGICSSDIPRIFQTGTYHFPTIPGHEFSGVVTELGPNVDKDWLNQNVVVFPLLPCFQCEPCRNEQYALCENYNYFGSRCDGGLAEYIAVPIWNLVKFSDKIDFKTAALCEPAAIALHAVERGKVERDDRIIIVGTGTIALLAGFWCKEKGAKDITFICRNEEKSGIVRDLGFQSIIKGRSNTEQLSGNKVFECVGSQDAICNAIEAADKGASLILIGNPQGDLNLEKNLYWKILRNELQIIGVWNSEYSAKRNNWEMVIDKMEQGAIPFSKLITDCYPLEDCNIALDQIRSKEKCSIKTIIEVSE